MNKAIFFLELAAGVAVAGLVVYAIKNSDKIGATIGGAFGNLAKCLVTGAGLDKVAAAVNPTNPTNVFSQAANKVVQTVTGNPDTSLGSTIADYFPSAAEKKVNQMLARDPGVAAVLPGTGPAQTYAPPDGVLTHVGTPDDPNYLFLGAGA